MSLIEELQHVCKLLSAGVLNADAIDKLLTLSVLEHRLGRLSFHRSIGNKCEVKDQIVIQLRRLSRKRNDRERDTIALEQAPRIAALLNAFKEIYVCDTADPTALVRQVFLRVYRRELSQAQKAEAIAKEIDDKAWKLFAHARGTTKSKQEYLTRLVQDCDRNRKPKWLESPE